MLRIARAPQAKPAATASAAVAAVAAAVAAAQPDAPPVGAGRAHEQDDRGGPARIDTGKSPVVLPLVRAAVAAAVSLDAADARTARPRRMHVLTPPHVAVPPVPPEEARGTSRTAVSHYRSRRKLSSDSTSL